MASLSSPSDHCFNFISKSRATKHIVTISGGPNLVNQPHPQLVSKKLPVSFGSRFVWPSKRQILSMRGNKIRKL